MLKVRRALLRWVLAAIAVPVAAEVAERVGRCLENRRGPSKWSRRLQRGAAKLRDLQRSRRRRR